MNWKLVALAFGTLFLAELGDKTQLAVFTMVAEHKDLWSIFVGAASALAVVTLIGAVLGGWISKYLPTALIQALAGLFFVGMGIKTLIGAWPEIIKFITR